MRIYENEPMSEHTTFRIGGRARILYEPRTREDLERIRQELNGGFSDAYYLGRGSNLLLKDGLIKTPLIRLAGEFKKMEFDLNNVIAGAGVLMPELSLEAARQGYSGLEWASGVPGTVGGAVMMNAGAFDSNTAESLSAVTVMDQEGNIERLENSEIEFDYRYCGLRGDFLVLKAEFELETDRSGQPLDRTRELIETRREQQPVGHNSAGCIFKNTDEYSAGALIDRAGLKGATEGSIRVSEQHANYMINEGGGRFESVLRLIERVRETVRDQFDVDLQLEIQVVDE